MLAALACWLLAAPQGFIDEGPTSQPASSEAPETDEEETPQPKHTSAKAWYQTIGLGGFLEAGFGAMWPEQSNTFFVGELEVDLDRKFFDVAGIRIDLNLLNRLP